MENALRLRQRRDIARARLCSVVDESGYVARSTSAQSIMMGDAWRHVGLWPQHTAEDATSLQQMPLRTVAAVGETSIREAAAPAA